jgi:hypothetical protein
MKLKKAIKKIEKKTDWIIPFYFHLIHVLGLILASVLITSPLVAISPLIETYKFIVFLIFFFLLLTFSYVISFKYFRRGIIIATSILLGAFLIAKISNNFL